jgi:hypothetical protein
LSSTEWRYWCRFRSDVDRPPDVFEPGNVHDTTDVWAAFLMFLLVFSEAQARTLTQYIGSVRSTLLKLDVECVPPVPASFTAGLARIRGTPAVQHFKQPASAAMVVHLLANRAIALPIRATVACMWAAGLRVGEVTSPTTKQDALPEEFLMRRRDVRMAADGGSFSLLLRHSKADVNNCGHVVHVMANRDAGGSLAPSSSCPVWMMQQLLASSSSGDPEDPLFAFRNGAMVTRQHVADAIKATASTLGVDPTLFSTHSLRIGAATTLAARQVSTLDILSWGRWRTEATALRYLRLSPARLLLIGAALAL